MRPDQLDLFTNWKAIATEVCTDACGLIPDKVPDQMWLHYFREGLSAGSAGCLLASLIS